jgi:hypothetical protein
MSATPQLAQQCIHGLLLFRDPLALAGSDFLKLVNDAMQHTDMRR